MTTSSSRETIVTTAPTPTAVSASPTVSFADRGSPPDTDVIDRLASIVPGSSTDEVRRRRPETRLNAQRSYLALFEPEVPGTVTALERFTVAAFVSGLHTDGALTDFYSGSLARLELGSSTNAAILAASYAEATRGATSGPYGHYSQAPLALENTDGVHYRVADDHHGVLGTRLVAALEHAHLLVFRPRESSRAALDVLLAAGWSTTDIVTLSQLVAFLSFQVRVVSGLRILAASTTASPATHPTTAVSAPADANLETSTR